MAFIRLTNEKSPKLAIDCNNNLNYKNKAGEIKQRQAETALVEIIEEAGKVASMDVGVVTIGAKINNSWKNFYVDRQENKNIVLKPVDSAQNRDTFIYVNSIQKNNGSYFYSINTQKEPGKKLVEGIGISEFTNKDNSKSFYVDCGARLANETIKKELLEKGNGYIAIVSKDNFRVVNEAEMFSQKTADNDRYKINGDKETDITHSVKDDIEKGVYDHLEKEKGEEKDKFKEPNEIDR
ncbi:cpp47 [Campylobacter hyointestinalis subsp. hyointestinalis]|uniref:Cpp47 n=1 Tax=Campylobacter hyointestinalis subsp. hyointestinalis TaxID=91352 RepID=A0A9W5EU55_CAMHY|nr:hypothetical protein [Campylobacter hyointestinalis]CUU78966.1 cpp47 [Campylobacter hyointestinalis subsp. hyointestinalis]